MSLEQQSPAVEQEPAEDLEAADSVLHAPHSRMRHGLQFLHCMRHEGVVRNIIAFSALINAWGKGHQPERALELFEAMKQQGLVPDVITYTALISACERFQHPDRSLELFEA